MKEKRMRSINVIRRIIVLTVAILLGLSVHAQETARRLILKDGSYQLATKYEVKGDRVRYYSSEREEWEEIPNAMVDWPATENYERDRAAGAASPAVVQLNKEIENEREREEVPLPQAAPGLRLPEDSGVFLLDSFQGEAQLNEIQQTAGDIGRNTKTNIFRGAINPVAGLKMSIELDGAHAHVQSHVGVPSLYLNVEDTPDRPNQPAQPTKDSTAQSPQAALPDRFRIVHTEVKSGKRIVGDIKRAVTGKVSEQQHFVKTTTTPLTGGWLKITPTEPLQAGEYVLVEMIHSEGKEGMNLYVWDFGVNPKAPANANPWKPEAKSPPAEVKRDN